MADSPELSDLQSDSEPEDEDPADNNADNVQESLIQLVRDNPFIYDTSLNDYMNANMKKEFWDSAAARLSTDRQKFTGKALQQIWKVLRDGFQRALKKENVIRPSGDSQQKPRKKWKFFDQMLFLKDCTNKNSRSTSSNMSAPQRSAIQRTPSHSTKKPAASRSAALDLRPGAIFQQQRRAHVAVSTSTSSASPGSSSVAPSESSRSSPAPSVLLTDDAELIHETREPQTLPDTSSITPQAFPSTKRKQKHDHFDRQLQLIDKELKQKPSQNAIFGEYVGSTLDNLPKHKAAKCRAVIFEALSNAENDFDFEPIRARPALMSAAHQRRTDGRDTAALQAIEMRRRRLLLLKKALLIRREIERRRRKRRFFRRPAFCQRRQAGFFFQWMPRLRSDSTGLFVKYFRMSAAQFDEVVRLASPHLQPFRQRLRCDSLSREEMIGVTIRYLAGGASQTELAFSWCIPFATLCKLIPTVLDALWAGLSDQFLPSPTTAALAKTASDFWQRWNFPLTCGAVDGKHVLIVKPMRSGSNYFNYKKSHSVILMALCDARYRFTFVDVGQCGRFSDGGVFSQCELFKAIESGSLKFPAPQPLPGTSTVCPHVVLGDEAFPLKPWLLRPIPGKSLSTVADRVYNYRLSRGRRMIENTFGIMAARWRIFRAPIVGNVSLVDKIIKACCCLHNVLMNDWNDRGYCPPSFVDYEKDGEMVSGQWRETIKNDTNLISITAKNRNFGFEANAVRKAFVDFLVSPEGEVPWQLDYVKKGQLKSIKNC